MNPPVERTPEQRAADGRLAWTIVGICAGVSLLLLIAGLFALRAPLARWAETASRPAPATRSFDVPAPPQLPDVVVTPDRGGPDLDGLDRGGLDRGGAVQKGDEPVRAPDTNLPEARGELQKQRGASGAEAGKMSGRFDEEGATVEEPGDRDPAIEEDPSRPRRI